MITSLFDSVARSGPPETVRFEHLQTPEGRELAALAPVPVEHAGATEPLRWYVAAIASEASVMAPARALERQSILANVVALILGVGLSMLLGRAIVRMRRDLAVTKESLASAETRARDLGSYVLTTRLAEGGQGEVWRAEHRLLAREAAIKLIQPTQDLAEMPAVRERFRREAQALAALRSRHTIEIFDYGVTEDGVFYYVMELLDGLDLETLVLRHGALPAARAIDFLIQVCSSLGEAHEAKLLHRDVKPANIYVCRAADEVDIVKVLDFGLVNTVGERAYATSDAPRTPSAMQRIVPEISADKTTVDNDVIDEHATDPANEKLTRAGFFVGTPGYMAPEQLMSSSSIDARADVLRSRMRRVVAAHGSHGLRSRRHPAPRDRPHLGGAPVAARRVSFVVARGPRGARRAVPREGRG